METISFHSNQSSYLTRTKTQLFVPPSIDAICGIWKESASEEKSFENVDDGRRTDGRWMPAYTISSPMSLKIVGGDAHTMYPLYIHTLVVFEPEKVTKINQRT